MWLCLRIFVLVGASAMLVGCASSGARGGGYYYQGYYGPGPWSGWNSYYRDTIIIDRPIIIGGRPDEVDPDFEVVPPVDIEPDFGGMPDVPMDIGGDF